MITTSKAAPRPAGTGQAGRPVDLSITALILSVAAAAWFGWGQAQPPASWSIALTIGTAATMASILAAAAFTRRLAGDTPSMHAPQVRRAYWRIVAIEAAAILAGVAALAGARQTAYIPAWILLVVGIHFLPLARVFRIGELHLAGLVLAAIAVAAAITGTASAVRPSAVAGGAGGLACLVAALSCLRRAHRGDS